MMVRMVPVILSIAALAVLGALIVFLWSMVRVLSRSLDRPLPELHSRDSQVPDSWTHEHIVLIEAELERLKIAISEGIARVDRHEKRVQKTVTSARRLVRDNGLEHAGIEAEHAELQSTDAEGIEALPALPEAVEAARTLRFPGGSLEIGAA